MANTIKLKRASGSDPSASDLVVGEVAIRTDTAKLFTKKDDNSVAEIGATVGSDAVDTAAIQDDAVTFAKIQNIGNNKIAGRISSGTGNIEQLTAANVRSIINVEDGATADQTASEILTLIKTVDGSGSGLDADTLDGISSASFVRSDASDTMAGVYTFSQAANEKIILSGSDDPLIRFQEGTTDKAFIQWNSAGFLRLMNQEDDSVLRIKDDIEFSQNNSTYHKVWHAGNDGSGSGLDADTVDGIEASSFVRGDGVDNGETTIEVNDADFIVQDTTDSITNFIWRDHSGNKLYIGTANAVVTPRSHVIPQADSTYNLGADATRFANIYGDQLYGAGGNITGLNASNISSGTLAAARVATLNQDTTGNAATATALETARNIGGVSFDGTGNINLPGVNTSGNQNTSGNAATATALATARTIAGVSFDGTANISLNNNAITNGAGYITSADGGNAATLDSIDSSQFLRSDTADSGSGLLTLSGGLALSGKVGAAITAASDGSTITLDLGANTHQSVTLGGNRTFAAPSNQTVGQSGSIFITQDGTGSRTASFNSAFKFVGGTAPTLSTAASAVDRIDYVIKSSNVIHCAVSLDVK